MVPKLVILISGRGSNLDALLAAGLPAHIVGVVSNRADAAGLGIAARFGVSTRVVEHHSFATRDDFDTALAAAIDEFSPDYILLAGFMRILGDAFVNRYEGRLVNIHPSLLPAFPGLRTHARALAEGVRLHGCTVHFVTPRLDYGPIIVQAAVPVLDGDTESALAARVLKQEHRIFPQAVRWLCEGRVSRDKNQVRVDTAAATEGALVSPALDG